MSRQVSENEGLMWIGQKDGQINKQKITDRREASKKMRQVNKGGRLEVGRGGMLN